MKESINSNKIIIARNGQVYSLDENKEVIRKKQKNIADLIEFIKFKVRDKQTISEGARDEEL